MAIFAFYLDNYRGGHETVKETWENAARESGTYTYGADNMVEDLGLDWDEVYRDFTARNTVMDYQQQRNFPDIEITQTVKSLPAEGESDRDAPQGYGQNYIKIEGGAGEGDLVVDVTCDDNPDILVQLVEVTDAVERVEWTETASGKGSVTLEGYGGKDVWLVLSPLKYSTQSTAYDYQWTAKVEKSEGGGNGADDTAGVDDTGADGRRAGGGDDDEGVFIGACGCGTGAQPLGLAALAAAGFLARRRRH
jgi:MYXO-CTERM domain-containing protein